MQDGVDEKSDTVFHNRSGQNATGYLGVQPNNDRYQAAQTYLEHYQKEHPEGLEKERVPRPVLLPLQEHLLIRSNRAKTGYKGVRPDHGRFQATCDTPTCRGNNLGIFGSPEDSAQSYPQHYQEKHPAELKKERAPRAALLILSTTQWSVRHIICLLYYLQIM